MNNTTTAKITVIVPMYNSITHVKECLQSVQRQELSDIEILCVDAGSTDGTVGLIESLRDSDKRIKLLVSEKKSLGLQVGIGIRNARGKYVCIVESDDYIDEDYLYNLWTLLDGRTIDIIKTNHRAFVDHEEMRFFIPISIKHPDIKYGITYNPRMQRAFLLTGEYWWNGMYRTEFLIGNKIFPNESPGAAFQDKGFHFITYCKAESAVWFDMTGYCYRRDNDMSSTYDDSAIEKAIAEYFYILDNVKKEDSGIKRIVFNKFLTYITDPTQVIFRPFYCDAVARAYDREYDFLKRLQAADASLRGRTLNDFKKLDVLLNCKDKFLSDLRHDSEMALNYYKMWIEKSRYFKSVVVFGAGSRGFQLALFLYLNGVNIVAICDNNADKTGEMFGTIPIVSVEDAAANYKDAYFVITVLRGITDVEKQLLTEGIPISNINCFYEKMHDAICVCKI